MSSNVKLLKMQEKNAREIVDEIRHQNRKIYNQRHKNGFSKRVLPLHFLNACGHEG